MTLPHHFACPRFSSHNKNAVSQHEAAANADAAEVTVHFGHGKLTLSAREIRTMAIGGGQRRKEIDRNSDDNDAAAGMDDDGKRFSSVENESEYGDNDDVSRASSDETDNDEDDLGRSNSSVSNSSSSNHSSHNGSNCSSSSSSIHGSSGQSPNVSRGHLRFTSVTSGDSSRAARAAPLGTCSTGDKGSGSNKWGPSRRRPAWRVVEPTAPETLRSGWVLMVRVLAAVDDVSGPNSCSAMASKAVVDPCTTRPQPCTTAATSSGDSEALALATRYVEASAAAAHTASKAAAKAEAAKQKAVAAAAKQASKRRAEKEARHLAERARKKAESALAKAEKALLHAQAEHQAEATQRRAAEAAAASAEEAARAAQELAREVARVAAATAAATAAADESSSADHDASEAEAAEVASMEAAAVAATAALNNSSSRREVLMIPSECSSQGEEILTPTRNEPSHESPSVNHESANTISCSIEASPCKDRGTSEAAPSSVVVATVKPTSTVVGASHLASAWVGAAAVLAKDYWWSWPPLIALVTLAAAATVLARHHQSHQIPAAQPDSQQLDVSAVKAGKLLPPAPPPSVAASSATAASAQSAQETQMHGAILNGSPTVVSTHAQAHPTTPSPPMSILSVSSMSSGDSLLVPHPEGFTPEASRMDDEDGVSKGSDALFGGAGSVSANSPVPISPVCPSSDSASPSSSSSSPSTPDASITSASSVSMSDASSSSSSNLSTSTSTAYSESPVKLRALPPKPMLARTSVPNAPALDNNNNDNRNAFFTLRLIEHVWLPDHHPRVLAARAAARIRQSASATSVNTPSPAEIAVGEMATDTSSEAKEESSPASPGNRSAAMANSPSERVPTLPPPVRFLTGADGDYAKALHQWQTTLHWRRAIGLSQQWLRHKPQPHFDVLKGCLEHYVCGVDRAGRPVEIIVVNAPEQALAHLADLGVTVDAAVDHFIFLQELLWRELFPSYDDDSDLEGDGNEVEKPPGHSTSRAGETSENERCATLRLIDVQSLKLWDLGLQTSVFFQKLQDVSRHYPQRTWRTMVLNAPPDFSLVWRAVAPLLEPMVC